jgi:hypothetical protein
MMAGSLPEEGELQLGPVRLGAGKRIHAGFDTRAPVAWVTREAVPDAGRAWAALSDARQDTGLVPFLLGHLPGKPARPWDTEEFFDEPADPAEADRIDAAGLLEDLWDGSTHEAGLYGEDEDPVTVAYLEAATAPFSRRFPGLAPPGGTPLTPEEVDATLGALPAARIGLVPAGRPADVLPLLGFRAFSGLPKGPLYLATVVRSWEDRFGARLLKVGFAEFSLLVTSLPRDTGHAQRIAAEHWPFCDECAGRGLTTIPAITEYLLTSPIWTFWWD